MDTGCQKYKLNKKSSDVEGLAKKRVTLDPLAEPAVMTANIGRGAARLIRVISFNSFLCHGPLATLVKRSTGI